MEKIGFISSIIALVIGVLFLFFSNKSGQNNKVANKKNTEEGALLPMLALLFMVAYLLSFFYKP